MKSPAEIKLQAALNNRHAINWGTPGTRMCVKCNQSLDTIADDICRGNSKPHYFTPFVQNLKIKMPKPETCDHLANWAGACIFCGEENVG